MNTKKKEEPESDFIFTPENLLDNLHKLGAWSSYGLASIALQHYFPEEYDQNDGCDTNREVELLEKLGVNYWQDAIVKYHKEIGYEAHRLSNTMYVNER